MTPLFPSLESKEFDKAFKGLVEGIGEMVATFDRLGIRGGSEDSHGTGKSSFGEVLARLNELLEEARLVGSYIASFVSTDATNNLANAKYSELESAGVELSKLDKRLQAWVAVVGADELAASSEAAKVHKFFLSKAAKAAEFQMSEAEEELFSELHVSSGSAWGKLHGNVTSRLMVDATLPDGKKTLPMSRIRALAHNEDGKCRQAAYQAELQGWESVSIPLAAAINGVKGEMATVSKRRGWEEPLDAALFANNVDRQTLDAMQSAVVDSFPSFRKYLRAKARMLGKEALPWWDLFAPVPSSEAGKWDWPAAEDFVLKQFSGYSSELGSLADRAFRENWVDAEPREGKRDGAFCMGVRGPESRVMMNFSFSFDSVCTLAHELGHAFHNINLSQRTPLQRQTPMPLAETASIFAENLAVSAGLEQTTDDERLEILEHDLSTSCQVLVDIHSRFLFEKELFTRRQEREQSVDELNEMMIDAQKATYGDGLDPEALHPYMWAMKPHYYHSHFYNWPYTFGRLFGIGLYSHYVSDPQSFKSGYNELLSLTGMGDAAELASRFGIDIRSKEFWESSVRVISQRVDEFDSLIT